jgi:hypothetical protein
MKASNGRQVLSGDKMLQIHATSFHLNRGIGQGDTPSTLIFNAVFDILLTLLEESATGDAHAYADDLAHLAQQRQADLVCGFAAYTGIEISVPKVEAISVYNSPCTSHYMTGNGTLTGFSTAMMDSGRAT